MKAFAVLDGGGVKGAALAGCLKAAEEYGIEFAGFGGTSAGSIVALLASIGYTPDELLSVMCEEINFSDFLEDGGRELTDWGARADKLMQAGSWSRRFWEGGRIWVRHGTPLKDRVSKLGIYPGTKLEQKLRSLIVRKMRGLENAAEITFADLRAAGGLPLKIVASHLQTRRGVILSEAAGSPTNNVLTAVRASCCYPLLFRPVMLGKAALVDGGLASNLPIWLFDEERLASGLPVAAFDLTTKVVPVLGQEDYGAGQYLIDMIETALEAGDALLRHGTGQLIHVEVPLNPSFRTLDFAMSSERRRQLYDAGKLASLSEFTRRFSKESVLRNRPAQIEATYGASHFFTTALSGLARELEASFPNAGTIRCSVFLPFGEHQQWAAFTWGMDHHPDVDLVLSPGAGPSGIAAAIKSPVLMDWGQIRQDPLKVGMTGAEINKVPSNRGAVASVPVFDVRRSPVITGSAFAGFRTRGALSVDCEVSAIVAGWSDRPEAFDSGLLDTLKKWADVIGRIMT